MTASNELRDLAREEQEETLDFLVGLTAAQWEQPSLCDGWRVRDVVAHLVTEIDTGLAAFLRAGASLRRLNAAQVRAWADSGIEDLVSAFRNRIGRKPASVFYLDTSLLPETLVHHQDVRRPLGTGREIPAERLLAVLGLAFRPLADPLVFGGVGRRTRGLALQATDLDWSRGSGPSVTGPGEALVMAAMGRPAALEDLSGDGVPTLRRRLAA